MSEMGKRLDRISLWLRRRSHLPVVLVGAVVVLLLFVNEDTSLSRNIEYQNEISRIKAEIRECEDSAEFYRRQREDILHGNNALEYVAREKYHMQRPTEDVFIIVD